MQKLINGEDIFKYVKPQIIKWWGSLK